MREKGKKALQTHTNFTDFNFSAPDFICKIHRNSHPIGICPICLRDKLNNLICSVCGEQNTFFSCSCSDLIRNSSSSDVGSVGRISFLIENEKQIPIFKNTIENEKQRPSFKIPRFEKQRPNSKNTHFGIQSDHDHEEGPKENGFRRILKMFTKKREKGCSERNREVWILDQLGVSRSRSLCSFRESSSDFAFSSADFNSSSERASNFSEPRKSSFENNRGMRMKNREIDLGNTDDSSAFIDLRIDEEKADSGNVRRGGSCRITERETTGVRREKEKKGKKRVWGWILKHNSSWRSKKDDI